MVLTEYYK